MSLKYKPEIDGLRAFAVISVVLFHLKINLFQGGFTGVDIFFVISGYLFTSNIQKQLQNQTFSFKTFYIKRIKRIVPALFVVIVSTFIAGYLLLLPHDFIELAKTIIFASLSISNLYF